MEREEGEHIDITVEISWSDADGHVQGVQQVSDVGCVDVDIQCNIILSTSLARSATLPAAKADSGIKC